MKITKDQLKGWDACRDGYEWFLRRFPEGEAEYQDALNALADDDRPSDANWLMDHAGPDINAVLEIESLVGLKHLFVAGSLIVKTGGRVTAWLRAGGGIEAGDGIEAGEGIKAGWGIKAGGGMGVFAGLRVRLDWWPTNAQVRAKTKPDNLVSGSWIEPDAKSETEVA